MPDKDSRQNWSALLKVVSSTLEPHLAKRYVSTVKHWVQYKGPEWTATRLKAVWNIALLIKSGDLITAHAVGVDNSIRMSGEYPVGIEGVIVRLFCNAKKPSVQRRFSSLMRSYTGLYLHETSDKQMLKAKVAITSPGIQPLFQIHLYKRSVDELREVRLKFLKPRLRSYSVETLEPLQKLSGTSSYPSLMKLGKEAKGKPYMSLMSSLMTKGLVPKALIQKFGDFRCRESAVQNQINSGDLTFGKINVLQEGGAKARVICSPNAWVQYYCYPYHKLFFHHIRDLEQGVIDPSTVFGTSCVIDQTKGVYVTLRALEQGKEVYGVDLSSATDRFPLAVQQYMCECLGIPEFSQALDELKGPYLGPDGDLWSYGQGQPMGLYGSFPLFHLTHFCVLNGLAFSLGLEGNENFCVLGDDVVIFHKDLLEAYTHTLTEWGVPISHHKSFHGDLVEFAGFVISKSSAGYTAYRPYKHGRGFQFPSVIQVLHALGDSVEDWSTYWKGAFEAYSKTTGLRSLDLSPLIPDERDYLKGDLPGSRWLGSMMNAVSYTDSKHAVSFDSFIESWNSERDILLHQQEQYEGQFQREANHDYSRFDPEQYIESEAARKSIYSAFWIDPTVRCFSRAETA